jgi:hypothetical protein
LSHPLAEIEKQPGREFRLMNLTSRPLRGAVLSFVRAVRPRGRVLGLAGDGKPPAAADR